MPEPILARFPERLNGAIIQIGLMPKWQWPMALYELAWPVLAWELKACSEDDSMPLIEAYGDASDFEQAYMLLCDYVEKKLKEARRG